MAGSIDSLNTTTIGLGVLSATPRPFHIINADEMTVANARAWVNSCTTRRVGEHQLV